MDGARYADHLRADGEALARAAEGRLERQVPSCPEWTVADLVRHTGHVHRFWGEIAGQRLQAPAQFEGRPSPDDGGLLEWYREGLRETADVLGAADPSEAVWTWAPQKDVGFIQRRMAHETAVHRVDAELAAGTVEPVDAELAVDGIDEFLDLFVAHPGMASRLAEGAESIHLHSTDAPGEWLVRVAGGALTVAREHGKGDAAVRAPASDLMLLLWRRRPPSELEVFGDATALDRFIGRLAVE
jgi:uncharacterized protein (TIGR03083 family)